jgi:hypothetical protein
MSRIPFNTLGEVTEENNRQRFLARREQHRRKLLRDISKTMDATPRPNSPGRTGVQRHGGVRLPGPASDGEWITAAALLGLCWLLGLVVLIGTAFVILRWVWGLISRFGGIL